MCLKGLFDSKLRQLHERNGGEWLYQLSQQQQHQIIKKIEKLPLVIKLLLENKKIGVVHADIEINEWNAFKADISKGDYKIRGVISAYSNALWGRGRVKNHTADYDVVENIDAIYLGHTIVKEMTQIDNCYYIDIGSFFSQKLCIVQIE